MTFKILNFVILCLCLAGIVLIWGDIQQERTEIETKERIVEEQINYDEGFKAGESEFKGGVYNDIILYGEVSLKYRIPSKENEEGGIINIILIPKL